ncbi:hypothetical protein C8R47DRAFT_154405 [Mycena vitilis]|nr:hypothetical protein C8R47DRAFT_154405 [Mycena vitilis]
MCFCLWFSYSWAAPLPSPSLYPMSMHNTTTNGQLPYVSPIYLSTIPPRHPHSIPRVLMPIHACYLTYCVPPSFRMPHAYTT